MTSEQTGLTPAQKAFYQENGYLVLESVFLRGRMSKFCCTHGRPSHRTESTLKDSFNRINTDLVPLISTYMTNAYWI